MNQPDLFDAPAAPAPAPAKRGRATPPPSASAVVIEQPQLPALGAMAKIDGRWHQWRKLGLCGDARGWEIVRPPEHAAHANARPPRLGSNGWIAEPLPRPAEVEIDGLLLRFEWSEHGFGVYDGEHFMRHFRAVAATPEDAMRIVEAFLAEQAAVDEAMPEPEPDPPTPPPAPPPGGGDDDDDEDDDDDAIALQEFEAEWPEDAREDDPADDEPPTTQPAASEMPRDELGERLVADGLAPNAYILDLNRSLSPPHDLALPAPWNLPSRLFRFPIETNPASVDRDGTVRPRTIGLMHPLLADHPWVVEVEQQLGIKLAPNGAPNPYGYTNTRTALWWHAVDLVSAGLWRELLETRRFTTDEDIVGAVAYGLDYGYLTVLDAQHLLKAVGCTIPRDPSPVDALRAVGLSEFNSEGGKLQRAINWPHGFGRDANTWARIAGIERGWFKLPGSGHRYLTFTDRAIVEQRNLKLAAGEAVEDVPVPEGQML